MIQTKTCLYCGKTFEPKGNAQKFCRKKCSFLHNKKQTKKEKRFLCQWCGNTFTAERQKKFCTPDCHAVYMRKLGLVHKSVVKFPVKITIEDAVKKSREEKLTYGRYVSLKKI